MDTANKLVAERVVSALKRSGVSQRELERRTGIPRQRIARRLQDDVPFTVTELFAIAGALGISPVNLYPEEQA